MIKREKYISEVRGFYSSDLIKIITGVRRCGKSVVLEQIMEEIRVTTDNCNRQVLFHKFRQIIFHNPRHLRFHSPRHFIFHTCHYAVSSKNDFLFSSL